MPVCELPSQHSTPNDPHGSGFCPRQAADFAGIMSITPLLSRLFGGWVGRSSVIRHQCCSVINGQNDYAEATENHHLHEAMLSRRHGPAGILG